MTLENMFYNMFFVNIWILGSYSKLDNMNWRNGISLFVSGLALLVSLGCLCHVLPRELGIDYLGWIVGVLACLTTILLGWQIFSLFNIKRIEESIKNKEVDIYMRSEMNLAEFHNAMLIMYSAKTNRSEIDQYQIFNHGLSSITHNSRTGRFDLCSQVVSALLSESKYLTKRQLSSDEKKTLTALCRGVQNTDGIDEFDTLVYLIYSVPVRE